MKALVIIFALAGTGCAARAQMEPLFTPTDPAAIYTTETLIAGTVRLGGVEGFVCSREGITVADAEALAMIRQRAASLGATGIYKLRYHSVGLFQCGFQSGRRYTGIAIRDPRKLASRP